MERHAHDDANRSRTGTPPRRRRSRLLRRAVFGDWHPLLRDPLDLLRLSFAAAAAAFALAGSFEYSLRLAATFLLVVGAQRLRLPRLFDLLFIIGMWLQAWGNACAYSRTSTGGTTSYTLGALASGVLLMLWTTGRRHAERRPLP